MFNWIYKNIYDLGTLTADIFSSFFKLIGKLFVKLFRFCKASFSSAKTFFKRSVVFAVIIAVIGGSVGYVIFSDSKITAVALIAGGEVVGYAQTENDASHAEALALNTMGITYTDALETEEVKTEPYNIKSASVLSELIVSHLAPELIKVAEIYIDGTFLCAVTDVQSARGVFEDYLKEAKAEYPDSSVSFAENISFQYAYRKSSDENIWTAEQLNLSLRALGILTICHAECEKNLSTVEYDTVEIQTNTLFVGDSRVRRSGQNGSEYVIDLVTYNGDKRVMAEHLMSVSVTQPVSQVVELGIRAESLSIGTYSVLQTTGSFCWPVVNLYTVTSNFGYRSLGYHQGLDISGANASGSLVVAGASGTVVKAGWSTGGYGNYVIIDHGNGIETLYGHMLDNSLMVTEGDTVTKGQAIGRVGNTGYSFGAHLHFEVRINGNRVNPAPYLGLE